MKEIIQEPFVEYQTSKWKVDINLDFALLQQPFVGFDAIVFRKPSIGYTSFYNCERKIKISSLKGKMTKQTAEDIDKQIEELRDEWERSF
jgi:predicted RNase H-related nuclease YkuK (DUF458 family)